MSIGEDRLTEYVAKFTSKKTPNGQGTAEVHLRMLEQLVMNENRLGSN